MKKLIAIIMSLAILFSVLATNVWGDTIKAVAASGNKYLPVESVKPVYYDENGYPFSMTGDYFLMEIKYKSGNIVKSIDLEANAYGFSAEGSDYNHDGIKEVKIESAAGFEYSTQAGISGSLADHRTALEKWPKWPRFYNVSLDGKLMETTCEFKDYFKNVYIPEMDKYIMNVNFDNESDTEQAVMVATFLKKAAQELIDEKFIPYKVGRTYFDDDNVLENKLDEWMNSPENQPYELLQINNVYNQAKLTLKDWYQGDVGHVVTYKIENDLKSEADELYIDTSRYALVLYNPDTSEAGLQAEIHFLTSKTLYEGESFVDSFNTQFAGEYVINGFIKSILVKFDDDKEIIGFKTGIPLIGSNDDMVLGKYVIDTGNQGKKWLTNTFHVTLK